MSMKLNLIYTSIIFFICASSFAQDFVLHVKKPGAVPILTTEGPAPVYVDEKDHKLVKKAAALFQQDMEAVSGKKPALYTSTSLSLSAPTVIIIGSLDNSPIIKRLVKEKKLDVKGILGQWEAY